MPLDKKTLKAYWLGQYASQLDERLQQVEAGQGLHLSQIEARALKLRREGGQEVREALAVHESSQQEVDGACPECQRVMRYKGRKRKWLKTGSGEVQVERAYY